ncbi:7901_t:CDS:1 [Funneliformis caledonium]|uniref:7901_t:CDS:1 n=1 Tax=Funneliformis caledonium TaxID=1117310 RepID=A0A9N8ZVJ8_9GLOM|nr:7901_t:CDS:1 [Funneliformis caledonium]
MYHLIHAHSRYTKDESSSIESQATMSQMQLCEEKNGRTSHCEDLLILIDTFEDKSRIATLIDYEIFDSDLKELIYYIRRVAEFGFDHIIIIGETECKMIFLDCYDRVFLWDDESQMLWPFGNSPEEATKRLVKGKDQLRWFVVNGIVYEYITKWQDFY